jgi:hypothetical protein
MILKKRFSHSYSTIALVASLAISSACTQKADPTQQQKTVKVQVTNPILEDLKQEKDQLSWLGALVKDSKNIDAWEENDGLVALFQGNTALAFEKLAPQLEKLSAIQDQSTEVIAEKKLIAIGLLRASLALSETHSLLRDLKKELFLRWTEIEAQREASILSQDQIKWLKSRFTQSQPSFETVNVPFSPTNTYTSWQSALKDFQEIQNKNQFNLSQILSLHTNPKSFTVFEAVDRNQIKLKVEDPAIHLFYQQYYAWIAYTAVDLYTNVISAEERKQNAIDIYKALALDALGQSDQAIVLLEGIQEVSLVDQNLLILSEHTDLSAMEAYRKSLLVALYQQKALRMLNQNANINELIAKSDTLISALNENVQKKSLITSKLHLHYAQAFKKQFEQLKALSVNETYDLRLTSLPKLPSVEESKLKEESILFPQVRQPMLKQYQEQIANQPKLIQLNLPERLIDAQQRKYAQSMALQNELVWALKNFEGSEERGLEIGGRNHLNALLQNTIINLYTQRLRVASTYLNRIRPHLVAVHWSLDMLSDLLTHQAQQNQNGVNAGQ